MWREAFTVAAATCAAPTDTLDARWQYEAYANRALEIAALASEKDTDRLAQFVSPDAKFRLGSGDVGLPFKDGVSGSLALAAALNLSDYAYRGYDYMSFNQDPCTATQIEIRFIHVSGRSFADVEFSFENGLLVSAYGWMYSLNTGKMADVANGVE